MTTQMVSDEELSGVVQYVGRTQVTVVNLAMGKKWEGLDVRGVAGSGECEDEQEYRTVIYRTQRAVHPVYALLRLFHLHDTSSICMSVTESVNMDIKDTFG